MEEREAAAWYRKEGGDELALRFRKELRQTIDRIAANPGHFPFVTAWERKALLKVFPYAVIFEELEIVLRINAISHAKREPMYWVNRSNQT
jgi:plasmid stabilization system protein ParE